MKKLLCLFFSILLTVVSLSGISCADTSTTISANITGNFDLTAKQWYASAQARAIVTICTYLDVLTNKGDHSSSDMSDFLVNHKTYVGLSGNQRQIAIIGYYGNTTMLVMIYTPSTNQIEYTELKFSGTTMGDSYWESLMPQFLESANPLGKYEENDKSEILSAINDILGK